AFPLFRLGHNVKSFGVVVVLIVANYRQMLVSSAIGSTETSCRSAVLAVAAGPVVATVLAVAAGPVVAIVLAVAAGPVVVLAEPFVLLRSGMYRKIHLTNQHYLTIPMLC